MQRPQNREKQNVIEMKFEKNGMKFEVSNLDHVVINTVRQIIKAGKVTDHCVKPLRVTNEKERNLDLGTRVWYRFNVKHGIRWGKFKVQGEFNPEEAIPDIREAELYSSQDEMQELIMAAMHRPDIRVWFSGTYVNIEICENYQECRRIKAQEENRKRKARHPKMPRKGDVMDALRYAISSAGAQVRQESFSTPFGPIPVMTITGSGDLLRDMERIEKTGQFISLNEAAKQLKISRR